jgi:hypothetical protein
MLMSGAYSMHGEKKNAHKALTRKLEGTGVIERHRRRWEGNEIQRNGIHIVTYSVFA